METTCSTVLDEIQHAVSLGGRGSVVAFQCTVAAAKQAVRDALDQEIELERAAPSLAHQDRLARLRAELEAAVHELRAACTPQAHVLLEPRREVRSILGRILRGRSDLGVSPSWSDALAATVEVLEKGSDHLYSLASGQPVDAPARALAEATAHLLERHHSQLQGHAVRLRG